MMEKTVLFIDDDKLPMQYYVRALELKGFKVERFYEPDSALEYIQKKHDQIATIIMDIMMPFGRYGPSATNKGLTTGVLLLDDIRRHCPNIPVVVLTNVKNPDSLIELKEGDMLRLVQKTDCPPFALVEIAQELIPSHD